MQYDVAAKVVVDRAKEAILRRFLGLEPDTIQLIEALPQETVSLKRSDFPLLVTLKDGREVLVLLEIQTVFSREFILTLIDYTVRFRLKYRVEVIPLVLLLTPSSLAVGVYTDEWLTFRYQVVRLWEVAGREFGEEVYLYPFLPLMGGGVEVMEEAEVRIYESGELSGEEKGDLLTAMAIFAGLKDKALAMKLIGRRRDLMIQSAAYELIKEEGIKEGLQQGMQQGLQQGMQQGMRQGLLAGIELGLELKFGSEGLRLLPEIYKIEAVEVLRAIHEGLKTVTTLDELHRIYQ